MMVIDMSFLLGVILFFSIVAAVSSFLVFYKMYFIDGSLRLPNFLKKNTQEESLNPEETVIIIPSLRQIETLIQNEVSNITTNRGDATVVEFWNLSYSFVAERVSYENNKNLIAAAEFLGSVIYSEIVKRLTIPTFMRRYVKLLEISKKIEIESQILEEIKNTSLESFVYQITQSKTPLQERYIVDAMKTFSWSSHNLDAHILGVIKNACENAYTKQVLGVHADVAENIKLSSINFILDVTRIMEKSSSIQKKLTQLNELPPT